MTESPSPIPVPLPRAVPHDLQCLEIIGGNQALQQKVTATGLEVWIDSRPHEGNVGGDIYYFSSCGSGRVTRLAIVDVSGHGPQLDGIARWLRKRMRRYINLLNQARFARAINREFTRYARSNFFATGLLLTYFAPTDHLIVCNAGHPRPIWYSTRRGFWIPLDHQGGSYGRSIREAPGRYLLRRVSNLPLGVIEGTQYYQFDVPLDPEDLVVVYTDGLLEATGPDLPMLEEADLLRILEETGPRPPDRLATEVHRRIAQLRNHRPAHDDQTLIILRHTATDPPALTVGHGLRVLSRLVGLRRR